MPIIALPRLAAQGPYPTTMADLTWTAGDPAGVTLKVGSKDLILVRNVHATTAQTATIVSPADDKGRSVTITKSIAAGAFAFLGPLPPTHWVNSSGLLTITPSTVDLQFAVIALD